MLPDRSQCVCFTGHRVFSTDISLLRLRLELAIYDLAEQGFRWFLSGMAMGFDLLAAEVTLSLSQQSELYLAAILPCPPEQYTASWPYAQRERLDAVLCSAHEIITVSPDYNSQCLMERNQYLIHNSAAVLSCQERSAGGTAYTVEQARRLGLPVRNLALLNAR